MKNSMIAIMAVSALALSACGTGNFANKEDLNGTTWSNDCGATNDDKLEVKFTETEMSFASVNYDVGAGNNKTGCQTEDFRVTYVYAYALGDDLTSAQGALQAPAKLDLTLKRIDILPVTDDGKTAVEALCGGVTFTKGQAKDVLADSAATKATCGTAVTDTGIAGDSIDTADGTTKKLEVDTKVYQIMAIENLADDAKALYFGLSSAALSDGMIEARRPASLATTNPLKKR